MACAGKGAELLGGQVAPLLHPAANEVAYGGNKATEAFGPRTVLLNQISLTELLLKERPEGSKLIMKLTLVIKHGI